MATRYKISSELYDVSFGLIAIHSSMPAYTMVYHINSKLGTKLERLQNDFSFEGGSFPLYEWYDEKNDSDYFFFGNKSKQEERLISEGFFPQESTLRTFYLLDDKKDVDFLLRIDSDSPKIQKETIDQIKDIGGVTITYAIETDTLKTKQNLIL